MKLPDFNHSDRYCVFQSGENWFAWPSLAIRCVVPQRSVTLVPHSDPILDGICYVQNEFVPVLNLRALMNVEYESEVEGERQLMIMLGSQGPWGLFIDRAIALASLEISYSSFEQDGDGWSRVIIGSATYSKHVVQVMDSEAVYLYAARLLNMFWHDPVRHDSSTAPSSLETSHAN